MIRCGKTMRALAPEALGSKVRSGPSVAAPIIFTCFVVVSSTLSTMDFPDSFDSLVEVAEQLDVHVARVDDDILDGPEACETDSYDWVLDDDVYDDFWPNDDEDFHGMPYDEPYVIRGLDPAFPSYEDLD